MRLETELCGLRGLKSYSKCYLLGFARRNCQAKRLRTYLLVFASVALSPLVHVHGESARTF